MATRCIIGQGKWGQMTLQTGCAEQMWDVEGKEIDTYVVKKLLTFTIQFRMLEYEPSEYISGDS